jgi:CTP:molybdopterin cytidylyltransferase MocA
MLDQPALIIVATSAAPPMARPWADTVHDWRHLQALAEAGTHSGLPTLCVLPPHRGGMPIALPTSCLVMESPPGLAADGLGLAHAVQATAQSMGWLVLPTQGTVPAPHTIQAVAKALLRHPLAAPSQGGARGIPLGFGAELYSELVRVRQYQDLEKLLLRYPYADVTADSPIVRHTTAPSIPRH